MEINLEILLKQCRNHFGIFLNIKLFLVYFNLINIEIKILLK